MSLTTCGDRLRAPSPVAIDSARQIIFAAKPAANGPKGRARPGSPGALTQRSAVRAIPAPRQTLGSSGCPVVWRKQAIADQPIERARPGLVCVAAYVYALRELQLTYPTAPITPRPQVVAIAWNGWSRSIGIAGRDHPVRALRTTSQGFGVWTHRLIKKWSTWMPKGGLRLTGVPVPPTHQ